MPFKGPIFFPQLPLQSPSFQGGNTYNLTALNSVIDAIIRIPKTGNITKIHFANGSGSGTLTLSGGLFTVDATTGLATASAYGGMAVGTFNNPNGSTVNRTITLATPCAAVAADTVAVQIKITAFTSGSTRIVGGESNEFRFPYGVLNGAKNNDTPCLALEYDDGSVEVPFGTAPFYTVVTFDFANNTSQKEAGLRFELPAKTKIYGAYVYAPGAAAAVDFDLVLYDASNNVLASASYDKDVQGASPTSTNTSRVFIPFASAVDLAKDTVYYLVLKPTTTTQVRMHQAQALTVASLVAFTGGASMYWVNRGTQGSGAWTELTSQYPNIFLAIDPYAFGGGLLVHPGMAGGMRG